MDDCQVRGGGRGLIMMVETENEDPDVKNITRIRTVGQMDSRDTEKIMVCQFYICDSIWNRFEDDVVFGLLYDHLKDFCYRFQVKIPF